MALPTGFRLGSYEIVSLLGAGGMGEVYAAIDLRLDRRVALKILPASVAQSPERRERFQREAKTLAALNHPNIVTIHAIEEADGLAFLIMELVEGTTLDKLIPKDGLPVDSLLHIAVPLSAAVSAAHERGSHIEISSQPISW